jgi:hypothetical protein
MLFTAPLVFFSVLLAEVFWTRWTLGVQQKNKKKAAFATFVIILLGGVSFISYQSNHWMVLPAALGGAVGTYLTMHLDEKVNV